MLFVCGCEHDPVTRILSVRFCSPSKQQRAVREYRDVDPRLHERMLAARPHWQRVLEEEIAPSHAVRRRGETAWHEPGHGESAA
jgi:hypothetical protein